MRDEKPPITRRAFAGGLAAAGLAALLSGCTRAVDASTQQTQAKPADDPHRGGTLRCRITAPATIDPALAEDEAARQVAACLFTPLTRYDHRDYALKCLAAESYRANTEHTEYTFYLLHGATFHNNEPVTADCFKHAWERVLRRCAGMETPPAGARYLADIAGAAEFASGDADEVTGLKVVDDYTLTVTLTAARPDFPYAVSWVALAPVPLGTPLDGDAAFAASPVGNGPFQMASAWDGGSTIELARFDAYACDDPALLDRVQFAIEPDPEAAWQRLIAGDLDFTEIPVARIPEALAAYGESSDGGTVNPGGQILLGTEERVEYLVFNTADEVAGNAVLRDALISAFDETTNCQSVLGNLAVPATDIIPAGVSGSDDKDWGGYKYDPALALGKLVDAGLVSDPAQPLDEGADYLSPVLPVTYLAGDPVRDQHLAALQTQAAAVGVSIELEPVEADEYRRRLLAGDFVVALASWTAHVPLADDILYPLFHSQSPYNYGRYANPDVDKSLATARTLLSDSTRRSAYKEIDKTVGSTRPVIPLVYPRHRHVGANDVNKLYLSPEGLLDLSKTWLTK